MAKRKGRPPKDRRVGTRNPARDRHCPTARDAGRSHRRNLPGGLSHGQVVDAMVTNRVDHLTACHHPVIVPRRLLVADELVLCGEILPAAAHVPVPAPSMSSPRRHGSPVHAATQSTIARTPYSLAQSPATINSPCRTGFASLHQRIAAERNRQAEFERPPGFTEGRIHDGS